MGCWIPYWMGHEWEDSHTSQEGTELLQEEKGDAESVSTVRALLPKRVKKRRKMVAEDGTEAGGWEEYFDYIFPEESAGGGRAGGGNVTRLLEMAKKWSQVDNPDADSDLSSDESEDEDEGEEGDDPGTRDEPRAPAPPP